MQSVHQLAKTTWARNPSCFAKLRLVFYFTLNQLTTSTTYDKMAETQTQTQTPTKKPDISGILTVEETLGKFKISRPRNLIILSGAKATKIAQDRATRWLEGIIYR